MLKYTIKGILAIALCFMVSGIGYSQGNKITVNHGYIAAKLLEYQKRKDLEDVARWYGFKEEIKDGQHDGLSDNKGSSIEFISAESDSISQIKFITVHSGRNIEEELKDCGFLNTDKPRIDILEISGIRLEKTTKHSRHGKTAIVRAGTPTVVYLLRN